MTTILLHGFWGQPKDWNLVLAQLPLGKSVLAPDLYEPGLLAPTTLLADWAGEFWKWVEAEVGQDPVTVVGYSMGARLALNAVLNSPSRIERALLISGNPVLAEGECDYRLGWEEGFAKKFLHEDWPHLKLAWQEQSVFANTQPVDRRQTPQMREVLGLSLLNWSPRLHPFGWEELKSLPATIEWAFGALDHNYQLAAKSLQELPVKGQISLVPGVGHRVIQEAPHFVADWISCTNTKGKV